MISAVNIASTGLKAAGAQLEEAARGVVQGGTRSGEAVQTAAAITPGGAGATPSTAIAAQQAGSRTDNIVSFKEAEINYKAQATLLGRLHDLEGDLLKILS